MGECTPDIVSDRYFLCLDIEGAGSSKRHSHTDLLGTEPNAQGNAAQTQAPLSGGSTLFTRTPWTLIDSDVHTLIFIFF